MQTFEYAYRQNIPGGAFFVMEPGGDWTGDAEMQTQVRYLHM